MTLTTFWRRSLGVAMFLGVTAIAWCGQQLAREAIDSPLVQSIGYAGIFVLTMACSASIFLPVPSFGAIVMAGAAFNPLIVGIVAGCGAATGELTDYAAGRAGRSMMQAPPGWVLRIQDLVRKRGFAGLFVLSAIPNPFFDVAGITAGTLRYPVRKYWIAVALGKAVVYAILATAGSGLVPALSGS
jgi:membrane protein YqaA with SNARE-associated domain